MTGRRLASWLHVGYGLAAHPGEVPSAGKKRRRRALPPELPRVPLIPPGREAPALSALQLRLLPSLRRQRRPAPRQAWRAGPSPRVWDRIPYPQCSCEKSRVGTVVGAVEAWQVLPEYRSPSFLCARCKDSV